MGQRRRQFSIGSLMIAIAIIGVCLAYPVIPLALLIPLTLLALPFFFLVFLALPLILLEWLGSVDLWFESRKPLTEAPDVDGHRVTKTPAFGRES